MFTKAFIFFLVGKPLKTPLRDSNPDLLISKQMRLPPRFASKAQLILLSHIGTYVTFVNSALCEMDLKNLLIPLLPLGT